MANILSRPMFKLGGKPNSDGVGITSGLNRRDYAYGPKYMDLLEKAYGEADKSYENFGKVGTPELMLTLSDVIRQGGNISDMVANATSAVMPMAANYKKAQSMIPSLKFQNLSKMAELGIKSDVASRPFEKDRALAMSRQADEMKRLAEGKYGSADKVPPAIRDEYESLKIIALGGAFMSTSQAYAKALDLIGKVEGELDAEDTERINNIVNVLTGNRWGGNAYGGKPRVARAYGNPDPMMTETEAVDIQTPGMNEEIVATETMQAPQQPNPAQDPYIILRARLPKEITDDVVRLIAYNQEAFKDFAAIETQQDVIDFNQTYGVELVVPALTV